MSHMTAAAMRLWREHVTPVPAMDPYEETRGPGRRVFEFPFCMDYKEHKQFLPALHSPHPDDPDRVSVSVAIAGELSYDLAYVVIVTYSRLGSHVMLSDMSVARRVAGSPDLYRGKPL